MIKQAGRATAWAWQRMLWGRPARPARPFAARHRDFRHRPRGSPASHAGTARRMATTPFRSPALAAGRRHHVPAGCVYPAGMAVGRPAPRCAGICHRRHDLALQGRSWAAATSWSRRACKARSICVSRCPTERHQGGLTAFIKRADAIAAFWEATRLAGFGEEEAARFFGRPRGTERRAVLAGPAPGDRRTGRRSCKGSGKSRGIAPVDLAVPTAPAGR